MIMIIKVLLAALTCVFIILCYYDVNRSINAPATIEEIEEIARFKFGCSSRTMDEACERTYESRKKERAEFIAEHKLKIKEYYK